jgi:hypothetical protein
MKITARLFAALLLFFAIVSTRAEDNVAVVDVSGTWNLEVITDQGNGTPSFTFAQDGETLTGQYKGLFGEAPATGTIKGDAITFSIKVDVEGQRMTIIYSGTVSGDSMKGTIKFGEMGDARFTGTKQAN